LQLLSGWESTSGSCFVGKVGLLAGLCAHELSAGLIFAASDATTCCLVQTLSAGHRLTADHWAADALRLAQQEAADAAQVAQQQVTSMEADLKLKQAEQQEAGAKLQTQADDLRRDLEVAR
jgi:hypothetical protein